MMMISNHTAEELAIAMLQRVSCDIHETPSHPLPFCPSCFEDEIFAQRNENRPPRFQCLRCGWRYEHG